MFEPIGDIPVILAFDTPDDAPQSGFEDSEELRSNYIYFYGIFDRIGPAVPNRLGPGIDIGTALTVFVEVDEVVSGHTEHAIPGQIMRMMWPIHPDMKAPVGTVQEHIFEGLVHGERYFFRAETAFYHAMSHTAEVNLGRSHIVPFNAGQFWYLPVPCGESLDLTDPTLSALALEMETNTINQRTMQIRGTVDMSALPFFQSAFETYVLYDGRFIDHLDYLDKNYVTVINRGFAEFHNLSIGDTISLTLRDMQTRIIPLGMPNWRDYPTEEIELTIVGLHCVVPRRRFRDGGFPTFMHPIMYVPQSILPEGFGGDDTFVLPSDYSFVLDSIRNENIFLEQVREPLSELGFEVQFFEHGGGVFIASADPIIQSVTFNLAVFGVMTIIALGLAGFIYLRLNRRTFVILRVLGMPIKNALICKIAPAVLFWIPSIIIGSVLAWNFAINQVVTTLTPLADVEEYMVFSTPSPMLLILLCAAVIIAALLVILIGGLIFARRPMLRLLQSK